MTHLLLMIESHRHQMFELAAKHGFTHEQTVACSQQLDKLLNLLTLEEQNKRTNRVS